MTRWTPLSLGALAPVALGLLAACAENNPPPPNAPQPIVPGSEGAQGNSQQQTVTDDEVVERIAAAHCDRSASCDRIGPGAQYRDRNDCIEQMRVHMRKQLNASRCPRGIGETALALCVKSLHDGECDTPGEVVGTTSHCKLDSLCLK